LDLAWNWLFVHPATYGSVDWEEVVERPRGFKLA
jgi:hypothetical protein